MKLVKNQVKKKLITKQKNPHHIEWQNSMVSGRIFIKKNILTIVRIFKVLKDLASAIWQEKRN